MDDDTMQFSFISLVELFGIGTYGIEADEEGVARALWVQPQLIGEMDKAGRPRPNDAKLEPVRIPADIVVVAIGQGIEIQGFTQAGIPIKRGTFVADSAAAVGDIIAWGGSYSFWRDLYTNDHFKNHLWAGVNGNHDNMDRTNKRNSSEFFRNANNNPLNGYDTQEGVCYHFTYGDVLFIMLNNEAMHTDEGLAAAQKWVKKVIKRNKKQYVVVMEHYQWFYGTNGKASHYNRWQKLFDECGVDLAISGNNHVYARTNALYNGVETDGNSGTVYIQTTSSDNERGQELKEWTLNKDIIKTRWSEGSRTVSGILFKVNSDHIALTAYDRNGNAFDNVIVKAKKRK